VTSAKALFTRADWDRLPEGFPAQLIAGELVKEPTPVYGHQVYASDLQNLLRPLVGRRRVIQSPVEVHVGEHDTYQPDVAVYAHDVPMGTHGTELPVAVFEVLSPSTRRFDSRRKRERYLAGGVREVWLVDPETKTFEVHAASGVQRFSGHERATSIVVPGFALAPLDLFCDPDA